MRSFMAEAKPAGTVARLREAIGRGLRQPRATRAGARLAGRLRG